MSSSIEKMSFNPNPDPLKQAQEVIVLRKINKPIIVIQNFQRQFSLKSFLTKNSWEQLGMFLDGKLDFDEHIKGILETSKCLGFMRKAPKFCTDIISSGNL